MYSEFILKLKKLDRDDFTFVTCHISSYYMVIKRRTWSATILNYFGVITVNNAE